MEENNLTVIDAFLDTNYLCQIEALVTNCPSIKLDDSQNHVMSYSKYAWNMLLTDLRSSQLRYPLLKKLENVYKTPVPTENLNAIQLFAKEFSTDSFCAPHKETPELYGPWTFMLYLSNEEDGALCTHGIEILPRRNRLVAMRTGVEHWVSRCSGRRLNITGWSFASSAVLRRWKGELTYK